MARIGTTPTVRLVLSDDVSGFDEVNVIISCADARVTVDGSRITYRSDNSLTFELTEEESRNLRRNISIRVEAHSEDMSIAVMSDPIGVYVGESFSAEV